MDVSQLATLRAAVGYLGEREQYSWWQSSFYAPTSRAFLAPVFGRTQALAQNAGVSRAAALVHDERIGVGRVFHLFRLPEDLEQALHRAVQTPSVGQRITACVAHPDAALAYLRTESRSAAGTGVGPVEIGPAQDLRGWRSWRAVAAQYLGAFEMGGAAFPYFTDRA
jgi:hypothetical protein